MPGIYYLPLTGLKEGSHFYDFDIDEEFFSDFDESEISECELKVKVVLVKRSAHMELKVELTGSVMIMCDRCLEDYQQEINSSNVLLVKFGDNWDEVDDEVLTVPTGESGLELSKIIYDFAHLAIPIKRVHHENEAGESECNPAMLERLDKHSIDIEESIDPRWKALGEIKDGLKN